MARKRHDDGPVPADEANRVVSPEADSPKEKALDVALRPSSFSEFVGQRKVAENLESGLIVTILPDNVMKSLGEPSWDVQP